MSNIFAMPEASKAGAETRESDDKVGLSLDPVVRKGQVKRLAGSDATGQAKFVASLFHVAA